jgi:hypothetical protein
MTFVCSICEEPSTAICVYCTKDACANHLCDRCRRCSDCCECDVRLEEHPEYAERALEEAVVEAQKELVAEEADAPAGAVTAEPAADEAPAVPDTVPVEDGSAEAGTSETQPLPGDEREASPDGHQ